MDLLARKLPGMSRREPDRFEPASSSGVNWGTFQHTSAPASAMAAAPADTSRSTKRNWKPGRASRVFAPAMQRGAIRPRIRAISRRICGGPLLSVVGVLRGATSARHQGTPSNRQRRACRAVARWAGCPSLGILSACRGTEDRILARRSKSSASGVLILRRRGPRRIALSVPASICL